MAATINPYFGKNTTFIIILIIKPGNHIQTVFQGKPWEAKYNDKMVVSDQIPAAIVKI